MEDGKPVEREDAEDEAAEEEEEGEVYHRQDQEQEEEEADEKEGEGGVEEWSLKGERQEATTPPVEEEPGESKELSSEQVR